MGLETSLGQEQGLLSHHR